MIVSKKATSLIKLTAIAVKRHILVVSNVLKSQSNEHMRSVKNYDIEWNETSRHC